MSAELEKYTLDELLIEFWVDYYDHPDHQSEAVLSDDEHQFITGDVEFDELEKRIAEGSITEDEIVKTVAGWDVEKSVTETPITPEDLEFNDTYSEK